MPTVYLIYKRLHLLHKCSISTKEYSCSTSVAYLQKTTHTPLVYLVYKRLHICSTKRSISTNDYTCIHQCHISTNDYTCFTTVAYLKKTTPAPLMQHIYKRLHLLHQCSISTINYISSTSVTYLQMITNTSAPLV